MTNTDKLCTHQCEAGNPCALRGGIRHTIHVCNDRYCQCHQYEAYQQRRARRRRAVTA